MSLVLVRIHLGLQGDVVPFMSVDRIRVAYRPTLAVLVAHEHLAIVANFPRDTDCFLRGYPFLALCRNNSRRNSFAGETLELRQECARSCRPFHRAAQDFLVGQWLTVKLRVLVLVLPESSALQGQTTEDTTRS